MLRRYFLLAVIIQILWGITPSISRLILNHLSVETYSAMRYSLAGCLFLAYSSVFGHGLRVHRTHLLRLAGIGVLCYGLNSLGTLYGLKLGGVLNFSLASSMNTLITASVAIILLREHLHQNFIIAAVVSVVGGLFLFWGKLEVSTFQIAASSLLLIWMAYCFEALGLVFSKKFKAHLSLAEYVGILQLSGGCFMWGVAASKGESSFMQIASMPSEVWLAFAYACVVSCCLCYFLQYWLLNHIEGHRLAFFDCFHSIVSAALGSIVYHESMNGKMIFGGMLLLGAVLLISMPRRMRKSKQSTSQPSPIVLES